LRRSRIRNTIRRKTPSWKPSRKVAHPEKCMPLQGTAALRRSCREISAMPSAIFKLRPPIILRGRWVTWLKCVLRDQKPCTPAEERLRDMILIDAIYLRRKTVDRYLYDVDTPASVTIFAALR
jgi:hypothetical protein